MNYKRLYIPNALIFITVVTKDRKKILITNIEALRKSFKIAKEKYPFDIIAIIINPDHFHMIIKPQSIAAYPKIIGLIKSNFTKLADIDYSLNQRCDADIWQKRYWGHTIIGEEDLSRHIDYIHYNSMKHNNIPPKDWEYSSFRTFVKQGYYDENWCNFGDKNRINNMNLE